MGAEVNDSQHLLFQQRAEAFRRNKWYTIMHGTKEHRVDRAYKVLETLDKLCTERPSDPVIKLRKDVQEFIDKENKNKLKFYPLG